MLDYAQLADSAFLLFSASALGLGPTFMLCRFVESEPDVTRLQAVPEDEFIIMASDGLWDVIVDKDSVTIVQVGPATRP